MIQKKILCLILFLLVAIQTGCGKKEPSPKSETSIPPEPVELEKVSEVDEGISHLFPAAQDYIYPNSTIGFQDSVKDNDSAPDFVQNISVTIMLESPDDIELVYNYYKNLIPEENFTIKHKHGKIQGIYATYFSPHPRNKVMDNVVQVTITQPSRNFADSMLASQIEVLQQQKAQYEKLFKLQEARRATLPEGAPADGMQNIETLMNRIDLQIAVLTNKTTLVNLLFSVEPREIEIPVKSIPLLLSDNDSSFPDNETFIPDNELLSTENSIISIDNDTEPLEPENQ